MNLESLRGKLIVSCQAYPREPMRDSRTMSQVAASVVRGGAAAVRVQGLEDIREVRAVVDVPIIGLVKDGHDGVYITPTLEHAIACVDAGADVVAIDATTRPRPDGRTFAETVAALREQRGEVLVMADCSCLEDAVAAEEAGADLLGTTLAGYAGSRPMTDGPDMELVREMAARCSRPVLVEGRVHTPDQVADAFAAGAFAVCVGTAITHPATITGWFAAQVPGR